MRMEKSVFGILFVLLPYWALGQVTSIKNSKAGLDFYKEIPAYPNTYSAGNVTARVIDGLGFRYYWATEKLRKEDLAFKPSKEARTSFETLQHIYELSEFIASSMFKNSETTHKNVNQTFIEIRVKTLQNFRKISDRLKLSSDADLKKYTLDKYPFWNVLNGPVDDALWHVGQVVSFRRSSGNPINPEIDVFIGRIN